MQLRDDRDHLLQVLGELPVVAYAQVGAGHCRAGLHGGCFPGDDTACVRAEEFRASVQPGSLHTRVMDGATLTG